MKCFRNCLLGMGALALIVAGSAQAAPQVFTTSTTWSTNVHGFVKVMVVGGGGGGGATIGSGGGGGEVVTRAVYKITANKDYTLTVGDGGLGSLTPAGMSLVNASPGDPSAFGTLTAAGGGFGNTGVGGGQTGGASGSGKAGGANAYGDPFYGGGGGGGQTGVGLPSAYASNPAAGGAGGPGLTTASFWGTTPAGAPDEVGGGGGGGSYYNSTALQPSRPFAVGQGNGGGGNGGWPGNPAGGGQYVQATVGTANSGGGGGAAGGWTTENIAPNYPGADGADGVVIIEFTEGEIFTIDDPLIHYEFTSVAGDTVVNNGSLGTAADGDPQNASIDTINGIIGNAILFTGSSSGVITKNQVLLNDVNDITMATWVYWPATVGSYRYVIDSGYTTAGGAQIVTFPGVSPDVWCSTVRQDEDPVLTHPVDTSGDWHHLAMTWDGDTDENKFYYDGGLVLTTAHAGYDIGIDAKIGFGCQSGGYGQSWAGLMDDAYVFDRALSATEIGMLYSIGAGSQPSMGVKGGASQDQDIVYGDASPTPTKGTDFGTVIRADTSGANTFTIDNESPTAEAELNSLVVSLTGADAADFSVTQPVSSAIAVDETTTFTVSFDPLIGSANGTKSAIVNIANNGASDPWTFDVTGVATNYPAPIMIASAEVAPGAGNTVGTLRALNDAQGVTYSKDGGADEADFSIAVDQLILDDTAVLGDDPRYVNVKATSVWGTSDIMAIEVTVAAGGGGASATIFVFR